MELIIKLDDDIAKGIRGENDCKVEPREIVRSFQATIADAIKNGTPYNPSGDLISRGVAINLLNEAQVEYDEYYKGLEKAKKLIDNAPPVKIDTNDIEYKAYCKGIEDGKKIARPKGEWIFDGWGTYCSECGYRPKIGCGQFCSECGADMQKGGKE